MTTTQDKTITELLEELHQAKWTDVALAKEIGVTGQTVYRWRHERSPVQFPKLVRATLVEILGRE
jgi:DNA-binding XRE family transcriptional regulator